MKADVFRMYVSSFPIKPGFEQKDLSPRSRLNHTSQGRAVFMGCFLHIYHLSACQSGFVVVVVLVQSPSRSLEVGS